MIRFFNNDIKLTINNKLLLKRWIKQVALKHSMETGDLNIIFCSDEKLLEINRQFLGHNYYTDIITFDYCADEVIEGELYISIDTVKTNAIEYKQHFLDELHRVIIHGVLHLCGFDDHSNKQKHIMREKEDEALELLNEISLKQ